MISGMGGTVVFMTLTMIPMMMMMMMMMILQDDDD
jgi:hypothetical protein